MQTILNRTAMANNVAPQFLEYVGMQDERRTVGRIFYLFNIMDPAHRRYKSTVAFFILTPGGKTNEDRQHRTPL
ncbi:hypothetical protein [uncultured Desulfosarcina sp.]|uniref:hypothetical protein n=1 Tax=uncultured Desulfosarcina sp. TaxID=218289 RepID=UPI0029C69D30|nr:hypothetical protein [uncultured Desulfosarcina sp.]